MYLDDRLSSIARIRRPQNLKKSPTFFGKTALSTLERQNKWIFSFYFVAFSENLNFTWMIICPSKMFPSDVSLNSSDAFDCGNLTARVSALIDHFLQWKKKQD